MVSSRPAHVLGDVIGGSGFTDIDGVYQYAVQVANRLSPTGRSIIHVPAQYVLVGDELQDLYDENEALEALFLADDDYPEDAFLDDIQYEEEVAA